jgi:hypothetical protein
MEEHLRGEISSEELGIIEQINKNLSRMKFKRKRAITSRVNNAVAVIVNSTDLPMEERLKGLEMVRTISAALGSGDPEDKVVVRLRKMVRDLDYNKKEFLILMTKLGKKSKKVLIDDGWLLIIGVSIGVVILILLVVLIVILTEGKGLDAIGNVPVDKMGPVLEVMAEGGGLMAELAASIGGSHYSDGTWKKKKRPPNI